LALVAQAVITSAQTIELTYQPAPVDNPLKGLVPYRRPHPDRFPHSMEFSYLALSKLVVGEREYDFDPLENILNDIKSRKNQSIVRVFIEYPGKSDCIPKYLLERGLRVEKYVKGGNEPFDDAKIETPDYENADLRQSLKEFIAEFGRRYDGDPRVGYVTAGLLGAWGEWHNYPRDELFASKAVQSEVLEAYAKAFVRTPVLLRYPAGDDDYTYTSTADRPFGYHDDSFAFATLPTGREEDSWFFVPKLIRAKETEKWRKHPIGGEIRPEVWGCCFDPQPCSRKEQRFAACRDTTHVTWLMDTGMFQEQAKKQRLEIARREVQKMGYEFSIQSLTQTPAKLSVTIKNTGLAPFYHSGWKMELGLTQESSQAPEVVSTPWELTNIQPGEAKTFSIRLSQLDSAQSILLRVPNPMTGGRNLRFANTNHGSTHPGWLTLKSIP
jgi:hypothetical protein